MILNAVNQKIELIKQNPHFGNPISKRLIPKKYIKKDDTPRPKGRGIN